MSLSTSSVVLPKTELRHASCFKIFSSFEGIRFSVMTFCVFGCLTLFRDSYGFVYYVLCVVDFRVF